VSRELEFHVDDASGRMVCSVRDAETGDLIRQIPNEEVLRLAELAQDETIVLVNERV
jgi:flagellar protein FlaG